MIFSFKEYNHNLQKWLNTIGILKYNKEKLIMHNKEFIVTIIKL